MVPCFQNDYMDDGDLFAIKWGKQEYIKQFPKLERDEDDT